jgi:hypothetical protein
MLQAALTTDPTISDAVRQAATAQAKDCLLHWLPMCEGNRAAQRGDWPHAIAAFERAAALAPQDISLWRLLALASAAGGHTHAYENACRELCSRFGHAAKDADLHNFVVATLLMPPNGRDLTPVRPLVETFAKRSELGQFYAVLYQLRSDGKNLAPEAVNLQRFKIPPRPEECFILSLAWSQAGDKQRGTALYEAGVQMVRRGHPTNWLARAVSDPLQREAAAVLGIEPDGIGSDSRPASPVAAQDSAAPPLTEAPR